MAVLAGTLAMHAGVFWAIWARTDGHFTYTLDDPYIHLALAEQIAGGTYGINPGESASPSSSMLWPFVLAAMSIVGQVEYLPLILNTAAALCLAYLIKRSFECVTERSSVIVIGTLSIMLTLNFVGISFTGMEHSWHIVTAIAATLGLQVFRLTGRLPWWGVAGVVVGPWLRYEGLLVTVTAVAILWVSGARSTAARLFLAAILPLVVFSLFLIGLGLDALPSSVLVKNSTVDRSLDIISLVDESFLYHYFLLGTALVLLAVAHLVITRSWNVLAVSTLIIMGGHLALSDVGGFHRYVLYAVAAVLPATLLMTRDILAALGKPYRSIAVVALGLVVVGTIKPMMMDTMLAPTASQEIYQQQGQMARFVEDYWRRPVAVNDIGLVSLRPDVRVVDLWGLADREARIARFEGEPDWLAQTVRSNQVELVMVYEPVFGAHVPSGWKKVAELTRDDPKIGWWWATVSFFATEESAVSPLCTAVDEFAQTTPAGSTMTSLCGTTSAKQAG
ncbi:MAG: hypothetical protein ACRDO2_10560 [Nocardioidaceae bacterium]